MAELTLPVEGMTCGGCVKSVTRALSQVEGVEAVEVTLQPGRAVVKISPKVTRERLVQAIEDAGFDVPSK
jgi:copper chaperone